MKKARILGLFLNYGAKNRLEEKFPICFFYWDMISSTVNKQVQVLKDTHSCFSERRTVNLKVNQFVKVLTYKFYL